MKLSKGVLAVVVVMVIAIISVIAFPTQEDAMTDALAPAHPIAADAQEAASAPIRSPFSKSISEVFTKQHKQAEELAWVRNPFRAPEDAPVVPKAPLQEDFSGKALQLTGISTIHNDKMAIINRQIVGKGDRLSSGHLVVNVTDDSVDLVLNDSLITLTLQK